MYDLCFRYLAVAEREEIPQEDSESRNCGRKGILEPAAGDGSDGRWTGSPPPEKEQVDLTQRSLKV